MQKHVNLVDLVKSFPTNIYLQNLASIEKRTSPVRFAHLAEKPGKGSISNLSTKVQDAREEGAHGREASARIRGAGRGRGPAFTADPMENLERMELGAASGLS